MPKKSKKAPFLAISVFSEGVLLASIVGRNKPAQLAERFGVDFQTLNGARRIALCVTFLECAREFGKEDTYLKNLITRAVDRAVELELNDQFGTNFDEKEELPF